MSEELRVALVAEGPTDRAVIEAAIAAILAGRPFVLRQIQPEQSAAFGSIGPGWIGVFRWCTQAAARTNGNVQSDLLFRQYHLLVIHLDADVADMNYQDGGIVDQPAADLPCSLPCPPARDTTDALRLVVLRWLNSAIAPPSIVLCTPSKSTEAWVVAALFPGDPAVASGNLECIAAVANILQAKPIGQRLIRGGRGILERYQQRQEAITANWPGVRQICTEAERFSVEFTAAVP